jgi:site-specific DNA-adenine methylase
MSPIKAPFPYFGGKSKIASVVWSHLGSDITNYVEPFAGSCAVLLSRPDAGKTETINDFDGLLANFWRAVRADPNLVAHHADWPVNECDLHARHSWLVGQRRPLTAQLMGDPDWYDVKAAGWWVWGACAWIGSGWCSGAGPWIVVDGLLTDRRSLPHVGNAGQGINRSLPHVGNAGRGIKRKLPHVGDAGRGINRKLPHVGDAGRGKYIAEVFNQLSERLRNTRVACGDFERVLGTSSTTRHGLTGVFLDPPYDAGNHDPYSTDGSGVSARARDWAICNGYDPLLRIVLAGYDGEHDVLEAFGWTRHNWSAHGGYGSQGDIAGRKNKHREVLWMNPTCR